MPWRLCVFEEAEGDYRTVMVLLGVPDWSMVFEKVEEFFQNLFDVGGLGFEGVEVAKRRRIATVRSRITH